MVCVCVFDNKIIYNMVQNVAYSYFLLLVLTMECRMEHGNNQPLRFGG